MAKVGVVLSGCGVFDGSEIHESVATILALDRADAEVVFIAPDINQMHVVNHLNGAPAEGETRNVRVEAGRIARGKVNALRDVKASEIDALIFPGGFGAAKNLCDFAVRGVDCSVDPDISKLVMDLHEAKKPVGFLCIAPAMAAKIYGDAGIKGVKLTIGKDQATADAIRSMGAEHVECEVDDCVVDINHKVVSTPAYMLAKRISEAADGIERTVKQLLNLI